jgi:large subunit ribosomal protein L17
MRHRKAGRKFGRNPAQRQALLRQLTISMINDERITTTEAKAKTLRRLSRSWSRSPVRLASPPEVVMSKIDNEKATRKLFEVIAPRFEEQPAATSDLEAGQRHGDAAPQAMIEFVEA